MKTTKNLTTRGIIPIIAIITTLVALGGIGAVLTYVMNNESTLSPAVDEVREERAQQAQSNGYPDLWSTAGLPEYPNGELTKIREGNNLSDGVQVTLETGDNMTTIKSFWDTELSSLGFVEGPGFPGTEYATYAKYNNGQKTLTLQITKIGETTENKIYVQYHE